MKKGFTLIELIGVLVLIGAIALITIPIVVTEIKKSNDKFYQSQIESIELSARTWLSEHTYYKIPVGGKITITLSQLKQSGYADHDLKNPTTKYLFPNDMLIEIRNDDGIVTAVVLDDTGTPTTDTEANFEEPYIKINGSVVTYVELGGIYTELGATATYDGGSITVTTSGTVNTSVRGQYLINYIAEANGRMIKHIRTVIVN